MATMREQWQHVNGGDSCGRALRGETDDVRQRASEEEKGKKLFYNDKNVAQMAH
jgi:hypothetical protein